LKQSQEGNDVFVINADLIFKLLGKMLKHSTHIFRKECVAITFCFFRKSKPPICLKRLPDWENKTCAYCKGKISIR